MELWSQSPSSSLLQEKLPPVRNRDYKTKMRGKRKKKEASVGDTKSEEPQKAPKLKSFDYRSWDKFDVVSNGLHLHPVTCAYL